MTNKRTLIKTQYADATKYQQRMSMHKYGTQKLTPWEWRATIYDIQDRCHILDIGCGEGSFWSAMHNKLLANHKIILVDLIPGMLTTAQATLAPLAAPHCFEFHL